MPAVQVSENSPVLFPEPGLSFRGWQVSELPPVLRDLRLSVSSHFWPGIVWTPILTFACCCQFKVLFRWQFAAPAFSRFVQICQPVAENWSTQPAMTFLVAWRRDMMLLVALNLNCQWHRACGFLHGTRTAVNASMLRCDSIRYIFSGYQSVRHTRLIQLLHVDSTSARSVSHSNQTF